MSSAGKYHKLSSYDRNAMGGHSLDWASQPDVYKTYAGLETIALPRDVSLPDVMLSEIFAVRKVDRPGIFITLETLSQIARLAYAPTARARYPTGDFYYRSAPSAGALYPCEIYLAATGLSCLDRGLYHYAVHNHSLVRLRSGDPSTSLAECLAPLGTPLPVMTLFITAIFFRSAWKYRNRAYRYHLLDSGHLLENLTLAMESLNIPFRVDYDFQDEMVNAILSVDPNREVCLAVVRAWGAADAREKEAGVLEAPPEVLKASSRVSQGEIDYPAIREIHASSCVIRKPRGTLPVMGEHLGVKPGGKCQRPPTAKWPEVMGCAPSMLARRSKRNFVPSELSRACLEALQRLLSYEMGGTAAMYEASLCAGFLTGRVEALSPGFHVLDRDDGAIYSVAEGHFLQKMARVCLDQMWLGHTALHLLLLTNLERLEEAWGPRGYRYAMLTAGRLGQRLYLGATAMGLGCCGIGALYDGEAASLLGLNDASRLLYLVGAGPVKK